MNEVLRTITATVDDVTVSLIVRSDKRVKTYAVSYLGESPRLMGSGADLAALYKALGDALGFIGKRNG